jgi:hypothetical protein
VLGKRLFSLFRLTALVAVGIVVAIPLCNRSGTNFGIQPGLLLACGIFFFYALFGRTGDAKNERRHSAGINDRRLSAGKLSYRLHLFDLLLLGAFPLYLIYFGNERFLSSLDTLPTRQLPLTILNHGTLDLSAQHVFSKSHSSYPVLTRDGELLSGFPIGTGLMAIPHTAIGMAATKSDGNGIISLMWEKHFAALASVVSVLFLFFGVRSKFGETIAAKTSMVFAVATSLFSCASQAMWSFTGELFFLSLSLMLLLRGASAVFGGIAFGAAFLCRPTAIIFLVIAAGFLYLDNKRKGILLLISGAASILLVMSILWMIYHHPLGGYGLMNQDASAWRSEFSKALLGNLISPSRGFLIYYPFVAMSILIITTTKQWNSWLWGCIVSIGAVLVLTSFFAKWWGGHSLGPRLLTETSILIALLTIPAWIHWSKLGWIRMAFLMLLIFSSCTQFLLIYNSSASEWNNSMTVDQNPEILWSLKESQLAAAWGL